MAKIHEAIADIMGEVGAIKKDRANSQQGYKFRGIDDVYLAVHDLFVKYGVFSVPTVESDRTEERTTKSGSALIYRVLKIRYEFFSRDGSSISATVIGEGMDSGDKASNKAMSVAHKYAILQLLAIPTEDTVDPEVDSHDVAPRQMDASREYIDLKAALIDYINAGMFDHPENVEKVIDAKDLTNMRKALDAAKAKEKAAQKKVGE